MKRFLLPKSVFLFVLATSTIALAQGDPLALRQQAIDAQRRGDVAGALALYADDAVLMGGFGLCRSAPCVGKAAIQKEYERRVTIKAQPAIILSQSVSGNTGILRIEVRSDDTRKAGVERFITTSIVQLVANKIAGDYIFPDMSDAQTGRYVSWLATQPAASR